MPILLKLHMYFGNGLKMSVCFGYNLKIIFVSFPQGKPSRFQAFCYQSRKIVSNLCAQYHLQFYADSFGTSQVVWSWSENIHVVLI